MTKKLFSYLFFIPILYTLGATEPLQPFLDSLEKEEHVKIEVPVKVEAQKIELKKIDMPYTENPLIEKYRKEYLTDFGKKKLENTIKRALPYRDHIHDTLQSYKIPLCIEFLPVIESDFTVHAISKSGAAGLWQFMENSIKGLLDKDKWIDERFDPWLSTKAAANKLAYNYSVLKNWELALAAYNMGLNGLKSVMKKAGSSDFWYLAENGFLKTETKNYVPKFIAIADLITNAEYYGIAIAQFDKKNDINFTEIPLAKQINVKSLSSALKLPYESIKQLNPALKTDYTPPYSFTIRIPLNYEKIALEHIESQQESKTYTVKAGDTLWDIAKENNITVTELSALNNMNQNDILSIGRILFLPIIK